MTNFFKAIFVAILIFSSFHLAKDTFQVFGVANSLTNILHQSHLWCRPYCDFVTYPLNFLGIFGSIWVLKNNNLGKLGIFVLATFPLWLLALVLS